MNTTDNKRVYDENNNLLAIEHENGETDFFNPNEDSRENDILYRKLRKE